MGGVRKWDRGMRHRKILGLKQLKLGTKFALCYDRFAAWRAYRFKVLCMGPGAGRVWGRASQVKPPFEWHHADLSEVRSFLLKEVEQGRYRPILPGL